MSVIYFRQKVFRRRRVTFTESAPGPACYYMVTKFTASIVRTRIITKTIATTKIIFFFFKKNADFQLKNEIICFIAFRIRYAPTQPGVLLPVDISIVTAPHGPCSVVVTVGFT